jgi:hypothetical protein
VSTDFGPDMDPLEDEGGLPGEFMDVPAPEGAEDVPWAHRVADEVEGPDSEWFRNQGWKGPEDAARSFRETKAELTRVQQEYARTLDALRASEEAPDYGYQQQPAAQAPGNDLLQQAGMIAQAIDSGELETGRGIAYLMETVVPALVQQQAEQIIGQSVAPVASGLEKMELDRALAEMEGTYGAEKARELARQVMPMLRNNPYFSTSEGIKQAFHAAYGQQAIRNNQRAQRAPGMETVDHSSRQRQQTQRMESALANWLVTPPNQ